MDMPDAYARDWPDEAAPARIGALLSQVFCNGEPTSTSREPEDPKHYKVACAWYGALVATGLAGDRALLDRLIHKYDEYLNTWSALLESPGHVDQNVFGIVPLEISMHTTDAVYLREGLAIADHQGKNIRSQKRFAIDDMFMITALQVQAYRASHRTEYLDLAASVMVEYLDRLQQHDGLFFHHPDFRHEWGRGNGWFAAGMAELLRELPEAHPRHGEIRSGYERMMASLLNHQLKQGEGSGLWQQIVGSKDSRNWPETSGSAMFTYALANGVRRGWLSVDAFGPALRAAWLALVGRTTREGQLQDISDWAYKPASHPGAPSYRGDEENYYFERPRLRGDHHGQAPMLWTAAALMRPCWVGTAEST